MTTLRDWGRRRRHGVDDAASQPSPLHPDGGDPDDDDIESASVLVHRSPSGERASTEPTDLDPGPIEPGPEGVGAVPRGEPVSLGAWLRHRREERGIELARVAAETRISRRYLEAIEHDEFDVLPAPVYTRGFVRSFARALDLDPAQALARLPKNLPRPRGLEPLPGLRRREGPPAVPAVERRWVAAAAVVAVLAALAYVFGGLGGSDDPATETAANADGPSGPAAGAPAPAPTIPPFEAGRLPDFRGVEQGEAEAALLELGLSALVIEIETADTPAGRVFGQSPDPGTPVSEGDDVTLVVSNGPPAGE